MIRKIVLLIALMTSACASNTVQILADDETAQHLLHDEPPQGLTRLYLFDGRLIDGGSDGAFAMHFRADELIDGVVVGSLNGGDVLVVDIPAGKHTLVWRERSAKAPMSQPLIVNLLSGRRVFVSNDSRLQHTEFNSTAAVFGAVGGAVGGAIYGAMASDDNAASETHTLMTVRDNGEEMIRGYDVILPNQSAVVQLRQHIQ